MKQKLHFMMIIILAVLLSSRLAAQDVSINILMQPGTMVQGQTGTIEVEIANENATAVALPAYKIRPHLTVPSDLLTIPANTPVSDLPQGWSVCSNDGKDIIISNGSDGTLMPGESRIFHINVTATTLKTGGPSLITAKIEYGGGSNGQKCSNGPQTAGNLPSNDNSQSSITVITGSLPVAFQSYDAKIVDNNLVVNWTTATEVNNDYFDVQVMGADSTFKTVGRVMSKATDNQGNSDTPLEYSFTKELGARGSLMGVTLLAAGMIFLLFNRRNKLLFMLVLITGMGLTAISCRKQGREEVELSDSKQLVRLVQVNKEGTRAYSKVAVAVKQ
ncbi:MAG: hypothetical protein J7599_06940 [Niabella sp.]|nr:hypothetical protein [Niabella sp.]